ncbi:MAG TPA: hypothetical protein VNS49_19310, partial [Streptomyces sp.]|nr:hypothetical protein [Streptomyces sp.]
QRSGPLPRGGPKRVTGAVRAVLGTSEGGGGGGVVPEQGTSAREALRSLERADSVTLNLQRLAELVTAEPKFELFGAPELSTVLFRPAGADAFAVAEFRRRLLMEGRAVLGRADIVSASASANGGERTGGSAELWLKATLLNPHARDSDLEPLLKLVLDALPSSSAPPLPAARSERAPEPAPAAVASTTVTATSAARSRRS